MIDTFLDWFNNLEPGIKIYWAIALVTSTIFLIQTILSLIGLGDFDMDIDLGFNIHIHESLNVILFIHYLLF